MKNPKVGHTLDAYDLFHTETAANELIESQRIFYTMSLMRREKLLASQSEKIASQSEKIASQSEKIEKLDALLTDLRKRHDELKKEAIRLGECVERLVTEKQAPAAIIDSDLPPRAQAEHILGLKGD